MTAESHTLYGLCTELYPTQSAVREAGELTHPISHPPTKKPSDSTHTYVHLHISTIAIAVGADSRPRQTHGGVAGRGELRHVLVM